MSIENIMMRNFLDGVPMSELECQRIVDTMVDPELGIMRYHDLVEEAKLVLASYEFLSVGIFNVTADYQSLPDVLKATVVRLVNIARHGKNVVTFNDEIAYLPSWKAAEPEQNIRNTITVERIKSSLPKKANVFQRLANKIKLYKLVWTMPAV